MQKSRLSIVLFVFLFALSGLFIGMLLARFFIPKDVGLAGGAMVLMYGLGGLVFALGAGLILYRFITAHTMKWLCILFAIFNLATITWIVFKVYNEPKMESIAAPKSKADSIEIKSIEAWLDSMEKRN